MSAPSRTRFAPSPTGSLHIGGVRTALYCQLWARKTGGQYLLRIEDTDRARSTDESARGVVSDLAWLGLGWDEGPEVGGPVGPYYQSQRLELYNRYVEQLLESGRAYLAWENREELGEMRKAAEAEKRTFRYRRRAYGEAELAQYRAEGRQPVVRLSAPDHDVCVADAILGEVTIVAAELDDIVIRKADGFPTYHFAVVVDDHLMKIDLVLRGQEHLMNTHKHAGVYEALGWEPTETGHLPLIFNPSGSKMSKRDKAKAARAAAREASKAEGHPKGDWGWLAQRTELPLDDLARFMKKKHDGVGTANAIAKVLDLELPMIDAADFRERGYLPEALVNYLALLGWSPGDDREIMTLEEMTEAFSIDRITKTPARFDPDKLRWMNGEYMRLLPEARVLEHLDRWLASQSGLLNDASPDQRVALFRMYRQRISPFADLAASTRFYFVPPSSYDAKSSKKHLLKGGGLERLGLVRAALEDAGRWEVDSLERTLEALCEQTGAKLGKFAQPLRIALSGAAVTPPIFDVLAFLGREEVLNRIDACAAHFADAG